MKTKFFIFLILFLISFTLAYRYDETIKKTFPADREGTIKLANINGNIKISTHSDEEFKIEAVQMANSKAEFAKMEIEFLSDGKNLNIRVRKKEKSCKVSIDFCLKVPEKVLSVDLLTILGNIETEGEYRDIKLKTVNGQIDFEGNFTGSVFNTVSDDITIYVENELAGDMQVKTYNGDIKIDLDPDSSFNIEAFALTGKIRNEFKLLARKVSAGRELKGTINQGRNKVNLKTQNGDIKIFRK